MPPPPPPNESCETAELLVADVVASADLTAAANDHELCGLGDAVWRFQLDQDAGVIVNVRSGAAVAVSLLGDVACTADDAVGDSAVCAADASIDGTVVVGAGTLPPGEYFVVVSALDGAVFDVRGDVQVLLAVTPQFCDGDAFDETTFGVSGGGNEQAENAAVLTSLPDVYGLGPVRTDLFGPIGVCSDDEDWWRFGHLGGPLSLTQSAGVDLDVVALSVDLAATLREAPGIVVASEGAVVGDGGAANLDIAAGFYAVRAVRSNVEGIARVDYSFGLDRVCEGDALDAPLPALDAVYERRRAAIQVPVEDATSPAVRTLCRADVDEVAVNVRTAGVVVVELRGDESIAVSAAVAASTGETAVVLTSTTQVNFRRFEATMAEPGVLIFRLTSSSPSTVSYRLGVTPPGFDAADNNTTCDTALPLTVGAVVVGEGALVAGPLHGSCVAQATTAERAFRFSSATVIDTQLTLTSLDAFRGALVVFRLPAGCASIDDAEEVGCFASREGLPFELPQLPAGDYLVVVEDDGTLGPEPGHFSLELETFEAGFPGPAVCREPLVQSVTLPPAGDVVDVDIAADALLPNTFDGYLGADGIACSAVGSEFGFVVQSPTSERVIFEARSPRDTVLGLLEAVCSKDAVVTCNDDDGDTETSRGSRLDVILQAGVPYFVVVDFFGAGGTDVRLRVRRP